MAGRIAILSPGLWLQLREVATLTGLRPVFLPRGFGRLRGVEAVAGWGHKASADEARALAARTGLPYVALEDAFLRSVLPGAASPALSYALDRSGIFYDARQPSDLERLIGDGVFSDAEIERAGRLRARLAAERLSKYNAGAPEAGEVADLSAYVLVLDQTVGDAAVEGALASPADFAAMLDAAIAENPGRPVVVKIHPDVPRRRKAGFLPELARARGVRVVSRDVDPFAMLERAERVYTVSSLMGFEALVAGRPVTCFGVPFYAGWGLTDDRKPAPRRGRAVPLDRLVAAMHLRYARYLDPWFRRPIEPEAAIDVLVAQRMHWRAFPRPLVTVGLTRAERRVLAPLITGIGGAPSHLGTVAEAVAEAECRGGAVLLREGDREEPSGAIPWWRWRDATERMIDDPGQPISSILFEPFGAAHGAGAGPFTLHVDPLTRLPGAAEIAGLRRAAGRPGPAERAVRTVENWLTPILRG